MLGFGNIAKVHALAIEAMPYILDNVSYVPSIKKIYKPGKLKNRWLQSKHVSNIEAIVEDKKIDIVDICSPNSAHRQQACTAIQKGKAVYLEKPLGLNLNEAKQITDALGCWGPVLNQVAFMYRFMPAMVALRDLVQDGQLGEIFNFRFDALHSSYLSEERALGWKLNAKESGGGPLLDLGVHLADSIRFCLGEIKTVSTTLGTVVKERPLADGSRGTVDVEDWAYVNMRLRNGARGILNVSRVAALAEERTTFEVYGSLGSALFEIRQPRSLRVFRHKIGKEELVANPVYSDWGEYLSTIYPPKKLSLGWLADAHFASMANTFNSFTAGEILRKEAPDFHEARMSQAVIEAAYTSAVRSAPVEVSN